MKGVIDINVNGYFAASNSGKGFCNYYKSVFGGAERIYIIKGGPGTGKSRFMREASDYGTARGWRCEQYYCSSDPTSLDGVILKKDGYSIAIIDGTPPHAWELSEPGVREEIVDLGAFWDSDKLRGQRHEIERINKAKGMCWRRAYKWLEGCLDMCHIIRGVGRTLAKSDAICDHADAILAGIPDGNGYFQRTAIIDSVGMRGRASSSKFFEEADKIYVVRDRYMSAHILLGTVIERARVKKLKLTVSYDPIDSERVDGVLLDAAKIAVVVSDEQIDREHEEIHMSALCRKADDDTSAEVCRAQACYDSMLAGAVEALGDVRKYHFMLEELYISAMDFDAKEKFTSDFCEKIFK